METPSIRVLPCWGILKYNKFKFLYFHFGSIKCETSARIAKLSPVTCMRRATALCFQPLLFPHVWWRERHNNGTILSQKRRADRQHELPSVWVSIISCAFARHGSRSSHLSRACEGATMATAYSADACLQGRSGSRPRSSRECSANATQGYVSGMCNPPPPKKKKRKRAQALYNSEQFSTFKKSFQLFSVLALEEISHKFKREVSLSLHVNLEIGNPSLVFTFRVMREVNVILTGNSLRQFSVL